MNAASTDPSPRLIAFSGASGSGKSHTADLIAEELPDACTRVSQDDFYRDLSHLPPATRAARNFDVPSAIDWATFLTALRRLSQNRPAFIPQYNLRDHTRATAYLRCDPTPWILVDGLWLLHTEPIRTLFDLTVFIHCPTNERRERRLRRDVAERNRSPESVLSQFDNHVVPHEEEWILPYQAKADIVLHSPVSPGDTAAVREQLEALTHPAQHQKT